MAMENYKMGWLFVCFDLPVMEVEQRKRATQFRKQLLDDGFQMLQYSVYVRSCVSFSRQETHIRRIQAILPPDGNVRIFFVTKAQWAKSYVFYGNPIQKKEPDPFPEQLLLWD